MLKRATIVAATLRTRTVAEKAEVVAATREHIWPLISAGKVVPVIHAVRCPRRPRRTGCSTTART